MPFHRFVAAWRRDEEEYLTHEPPLVDALGRPCPSATRCSSRSRPHEAPSGAARSDRRRDPERERPGLSFQLEADHVAPVWPPRPGTQPVQGHVDVLVDDPDDLDAEVDRAPALGATRVDHPSAEGLVVLRDPHGHPFCLFVHGA